MRVLLLLLVFSCLAAGAHETRVPKTMPAQSRAQALKEFLAKKKFLPERLYPGAPTEQVRSRFENLVNTLATNLLPIADSQDPKAKLMEAFKAAYPAFEYADTEERERAIGYFEELMDILGVESSDGLLNKLMYGFDPQQSADVRNAEALAGMNQAERDFAAKLELLTVQSSQAFLLGALGKLTTTIGKTYIWMRESEPDFLLSLAFEPKAMIVWMVKGRFMYSRHM
jgi:hypothetical protein